MYNPPAFLEDRPEVQAALIRSYPLATLVTSGPSGLLANVAPFILRETAERWTLCSHLARANDQIDDLRRGAEALIIFQGPQAYISPSWYPTKAETGKAVPTWNYMIVQARGAPVLREDPGWLLEQLAEITAWHEDRRDQPWGLSDAPEGFVDAQLRGIVGLEIPVDQIAGKWKVSQNQPARNRAGVIEGLIGDGQTAAAEAVRLASAP